MATALTLLIFAPFTIDYILSSFEKSNLIKKLGFSTLLILLVLVSLEGLDVRTNKRHVKEAGAWVAKNLLYYSRVYSNDKIAMYYARPNADDNLNYLYSSDTMKKYIDTKEHQRFDYFILVGEDDYLEDLMRQNLWYRFGEPVKMFKGEGMKFAFIYKLNRRKLDKRHE